MHRRKLRMRPRGNPRRTAAAAPALAYVPCDARQRRHAAIELLPVAGPLGPQAGKNAGRFRFGVLLGQSPNVLSRYAGDALRPLGRLFDSVLLSGQIGRITFAVRHAFRHVRFVEAHTKGIHKCLILQLILQDVPAHGIGKRRVRRRFNRNPPVRIRQHGFALPGVDDDDGDALLFRLCKRAVKKRAEVIGRRVVPPQDDHAGMEDVAFRVTAFECAVHVRRHVIGARRAVVVVVLQVAARKTQQALHKAVAAQQR